MNIDELFLLIDDPQQDYDRFEVMQSFVALAKLEDGNESSYWLEVVAFKLYLNGEAELVTDFEGELASAKQLGAKTYYQQRLTITQNLQTKALYGHLLWQLHRGYSGCATAISVYLQQAEDVIDRLSGEDKVFSIWNDAIRPALKLSAAINNETAFTKGINLVNRLLNSAAPIWMKCSILNFLLANLKNKIKSFDLDNYVQEVLQLPSALKGSRHEEIVETAIKIDRVLTGQRQALLWEQLGDAFQASALQREDDAMGIVTMPWMAKAMDCFRKARADAKYQAAATDYETLKKNRRTNSVRIPLLNETQGKLLYRQIEHVKKSFLTMPIEDLLVNLAVDLDLLFWQGADDGLRVYDDLSRAVTFVNFDINQNPKVLSEAGSQRFSDANTYHLKFKIYTQTCVNAIMQELIKNGQLNMPSLDVFFKKSWIGQTIIQAEQDPEKNYDLYAMVRPALVYYVEQATRRLQGQEADFILCIDTLVTKYEMLARMLLKSFGIPTTTIDSQSSEPRESYLPELLDKLPTDKLDQKDMELIRHIYAKGGMDLRNKVAHSFLIPEQYTLELADVVVWSIIRIGQFTTEEKLP
ncbi:DUF4209 domain-containing protein [Mucilaginibacter segetis]|uniref:DUF4209 domain-containing protein n=1 Tax=Mucilaginibacter segetis TaxID=2793071 RepID=A0A934UMX0_9SPHI|nr:DUF4209 domain-containing protein [Mucilaginibacter segetis]MBK0379327.1 DUF4209 domain-containing protein [Mucilaginibacter segetis]